MKTVGRTIKIQKRIYRRIKQILPVSRRIQEKKGVPAKGRFQI